MMKYILCALLIVLLSGTALAEVAPGTPPTITQHPEHIWGHVGAIASFSVSATGAPPLTYQWQRSIDQRVTWNNISEANGATYSFTQQMSDSGSWFRVIVSNNYGSATSNDAQLYVSPLHYRPIEILTQPAANTIVTEGSITGSLFVEASYPFEALVNYQWFSNITNSNTGGTLIPGATSASFAIPTTLTASGSPYYYYCVISYADVSLTVPVVSQVATVTVNAPSDVGRGGCNSIMSGGMLGILILFLVFYRWTCLL